MKDKDKNEVKEFVKQGIGMIGGISPFTITIRTPEEAGFLFDAVMIKLGRGNFQLAKELSQLLSRYAHDLGVVDGPKEFVKESQKRGHKAPDWLAPLATLLLNQLEKNFDEYVGNKTDNKPPIQGL